MKYFGFKAIKTVVWVLLFVLVLALAFLLDLPTKISADRVDKQSLLQQEGELRSFGLDWESPLVSIKSPTRELYFTNAEFSVISNEEVTATSLPEAWEFTKIAARPELSKYYYLITTPAIADGQHSHELRFADVAGNSTVANLQINALTNRPDAPKWENPNYYMPADSLIALANKRFRLPQDFEPDDLVFISDYGINFANNARFRAVGIDQLKAMTDAIAAAGINYTATSAYRSFKDQVFAYNYWIGFNNGNIEATDRVSARPGHSEHQLGTTVDFITSENGGTFFNFENTRLAAWLANNAVNYGFVISYPQGKEDITGYSFEPWHYRYIGVENSKQLASTGLTLTEWLLIQNKVN